MFFPLLSLFIFIINPLVKIQAVNSIFLIKIIEECLDTLPAVRKIYLFKDSYNLVKILCKKGSIYNQTQKETRYTPTKKE